MSREAFDQAVGLLGALSDAELEQLGARIAALRALSGPVRFPRRHPPDGTAQERTGPAVPHAEAFVPMLYDAASAALFEGLGQKPEPFGIFLLSKKRSDEFRRAAIRAALQHEAWFPKSSRIDTAILTKLYVRCAVSYLQGQGTPLCWKTLSRSLGDLPLVVDGLFPGYARSGLMSTLLSAGKTVGSRLPE